MGRKNNFEYIIVGSGPAGTAAALTLAKAKKRVCVVEENMLGGAHLNSRNIPYLVSLNSSHLLAKITNLPEFRNSASFSLPSMHSHCDNAINHIGLELKRAYKNAGITFFHGAANFLDHNTIAIGEKKLTADNFILATGAKPKVTGIVGSDLPIYQTPETALNARRIPKVVVVVGGGSAGCEIAEFYAELGSKVIILETAKHLLPREDKEASDYMADFFTNRLGITVLLNSKVVEIRKDIASKCVIFKADGKEKMIRTENIILATGSQPALDYGLENAGVKYKPTGIIVNKYFQTSTKHIYAIGDSIGEDSSTERANYEGHLLATNLLGRNKSLPNYSGFARITKTYPEIATIGADENELIQKKRKYKKSIINFSQITASKTSGDGFVKLLSDKTSRIIGATIVSPNAELLAGEISLAIRHGLTAIEIASTPHPIDNYSYAIKLAAKQLVSTK